MGQTHSNENRTSRSNEEVTKELARKFATKCLTPLEIYTLKDVFQRLADGEQNLRYLKEDTIARFLEIPDILHVSPIVFQMISHVGAFPFLQDAPAVLGLEQMMIVVTIMTGRYQRVLTRGTIDRRKLFFQSLAVHDRKLSEMDLDKGEEGAELRLDGQKKSHAPGLVIGDAGNDEENQDDEGDELVLAALECMDYTDEFNTASTPTIHGALIPTDNFRKLVMLLLLLAPLGAKNHLFAYSKRIAGKERHSLRSTAECILGAFLNVEKSPGIKYAHFNTTVPTSLPFLFHGFNSLFEHFLISKDLDLNRHTSNTEASSPAAAVPQPLLMLPENVKTSIMSLNLLCQLSFFIPGDQLFYRMRLLYSGDDDGFGMCSFENKVFNWRAPTLVLVKGTRINEQPSSQSRAEASFAATLPPRRFPTGRGRTGAVEKNSAQEENETLTFGVLVAETWRHTYHSCFGGDEILLFQLSPVHDVLRASTINTTDRVWFAKSSSAATSLGEDINNTGLAFGCSPTPAVSRTKSAKKLRALGPVSMVLDSGLEFGVFTHDYQAGKSRGGAAFAASKVRRFDFQERFCIEAVEVWGLGGDEEARLQKERWAWETREAEARRRINLGTVDLDANRALLEMAGLIGQGRSGGSMV